MVAEKKRVFVGNLPPNTIEKEIRKRFSKFGNVLSVEIKQRPFLATFAFLDIETNADKLNSCFATLSQKKWKGNEIKLELAKESFLSRLQNERQESNTQKTKHSPDLSHDINTSTKSKKELVEQQEIPKKKIKVEKSFSESTSTKSKQVLVEHQEFPKKKIKVEKSFSESTSTKSNKMLLEELETPKKKVKVEKNVSESTDFSTDDDSDNSDLQYNGRLKMFGGTKNIISGVHEDSSSEISDKDVLLSHSKSAATGLMQRLELFSDMWKDSPVDYNPLKYNETMKRKDSKIESLSVEDKLLLAEEKRKKSLEEKRKSLQKQKQLIKLALTSVDLGYGRNKIVFNAEDDENDKQDAVKAEVSRRMSLLASEVKLLEKSNEKPILFEDSSEDEGAGDFKIKTQFEGAKGQKLLELQSRFANDKRFALDERFYESDEDLPAETSGSVENEDIEEERKRQLEILQDVLGHQIPIAEKKSRTKSTPMLRFDPTKPDHAKYEVKAEPKLKKQLHDISTDDETKVVHIKKEDTVEPVVSKEKFYKVSEFLKDSLKKKDEKNEFSLRKLFGTTDRDEDNDETEETYSAATLNKEKYTQWTTNPFKHDSSDSEDETETLGKIEDSNLQQTVNESDVNLVESFFFKPNDPRLQEGLEFFSKGTTKDESYDFAKHRRELKQLFRSKVKNNLRNHRPRRKNLGGQGKKKYKKKY